MDELQVRRLRKLRAEVLSIGCDELPELSPSERDFLRLRLGLDDGRFREYDEIGQLFGVTPDNLRQIEEKVWRHIRGEK